MPYFVDVSGKIKCRTKESIPHCTKLLKRFKLDHKVDQDTILVNGKLHVTILFDRHGFRDHLLGQLRRHGSASLEIIGEEPQTAFSQNSSEFCQKPGENTADL